MTVVRYWQREGLKHYSLGAKIWKSHRLWWALRALLCFYVWMRNLKYLSWVDIFPDFTSYKNWSFLLWHLCSCNNQMGIYFRCTVIGSFSIVFGLWQYHVCQYSTHLDFLINMIFFLKKAIDKCNQPLHIVKCMQCALVIMLFESYYWFVMFLCILICSRSIFPWSEKSNSFPGRGHG